MKSFITNNITTASKNIDKYQIILITNVENVTESFSNYLDTPIQSEFFTAVELNDILTAIRDFGFETKCFTDELDFIKSYVNKREDYNKKLCIINSAQKGTAPGRKSLIPAFCDMNNILYSNSNAYVCSFTRDKYHWYKFLNKYSEILPTSWLYCKCGKWLFDEEPPIGTKIIAKLRNESSSIGLNQGNIMTYNKSCETFLDKLSTQYNQRILVQKFINGYEIETPIISDGITYKALLPVGISMNGNKMLGDKILDYKIRYDHSYEFYNYYEFNQSAAKKIMSVAEQIASDIELKGISRIDFRIMTDGKFFITDINANPHLTRDMSVCFSFKECGFSDYSSIFATLIGLTLKNQSSSQS